MREILFRGKQVFFNDWIEGTGIFNDGINTWISFNEPEKAIAYGLNHKRVHAETIGEFTGLTDKNGKKIFEGDVVRVCLDPEICVGKVIWDSEIASYNIPFNNGKCVLPLDIFIAKNKVGDKVWIDVIGNIHDNPELLETP